MPSTTQRAVAARRRAGRRPPPAGRSRRPGGPERPAPPSPPIASVGDRRWRPGGRGWRSSSARHSTAMAPWPTCGSMTLGRQDLGGPVGEPRRSRAAAATTTAPPAGTRSSRVGDVAPQAGERQVGAQPGQLGPPADRAGGDQRAGPQVRPGVAPDQGVRGSARAGARRPAPGPGASSRWQVLGRVHGHVGPAVEHRGLHLLDEHALAAHAPRPGCPRRRSPVVSTMTSSTSSPGRRDRSRRATSSACQRARALPRVAIRSVGQGAAARCRARTAAAAPGPAAPRRGFPPRT